MTAGLGNKLIQRVIPVELAHPHHNIVVCASLDLVGLLVLAVALAILRGLPLQGQVGWLITTTFLYLLLGWLLGTYTVLEWRHLPCRSLLQRLGLHLSTTLVVVATLCWLVNPPLSTWVVYHSSQMMWLLPAAFWSGVVRVRLRRSDLLRREETDLLLVAGDEEAHRVLAAWEKTPRRLMPHRVTPEQAVRRAGPVILAVSDEFQQLQGYRSWLKWLDLRDCHICNLTTPLALAEWQLERLPPTLLPESWVGYGDLPWIATFNPQRQLKRVADVLIAFILLMFTMPIVLLAALLIWIEDHGPIVYIQERSGWLGKPFWLLKLRTMKVASCSSPAKWTMPGDQRITCIGYWLRRSRLDELPQLLNVLRGEMSLIGPRPERPELERELEACIPHYRKRHWMQPGLSGWAQVCAPYASSVEDSELKLSYDLYYIKNFSTWIDLLILLRTVKTLLKVAGR